MFFSTILKTIQTKHIKRNLYMNTLQNESNPVEKNLSDSSDFDASKIPVPQVSPEQLASAVQQDTTMLEINGQKIPLNVYLQSMNRHGRRKFLSDMQKAQNSKKIKLSRADTVVPEINAPIVPQLEIEEEEVLTPPMEED